MASKSLAPERMLAAERELNESLLVCADIHRLNSDELATVSVFAAVEAAVDLEGVSRQQAVAALERALRGYQIYAALGFAPGSGTPVDRG